MVAIVGLLGASGWMAWQHQHVVKERQRAAAFIATARQGVINLTSLDFNKAKEDVQRVLDIATGEFKDDFQKRAEDFAAVVKDSKASRKSRRPFCFLLHRTTASPAAASFRFTANPDAGDVGGS